MNKQTNTPNNSCDYGTQQQLLPNAFCLQYFFFTNEVHSPRNYFTNKYNARFLAPHI